MGNGRKYGGRVRLYMSAERTKTKLDAFSKRLGGTNIKPAGVDYIGDRVAYTYKTSESGLPVVLKRWNQRLGSGMDAAQVTVEIA